MCTQSLADCYSVLTSHGRRWVLRAEPRTGRGNRFLSHAEEAVGWGLGLSLCQKHLTQPQWITREVRKEWSITLGDVTAG